MGGRESSSLKTWMFLALLRKEVMPAFYSFNLSNTPRISLAEFLHQAHYYRHGRLQE
jgi:hypothetical protein